MKSKSIRRRIEELEEKSGLNQDSEEARQRYEQMREKRLNLLRSHHFLDVTLRRWEPLWELEKKFSRKENRKMNFGLNVVFVDKADDESFRRVRNFVALPSLSQDHKKAIQVLRSELAKSDG